MKFLFIEVTRRTKYLKPNISNIFLLHATLAANLRVHDHYIVVEAYKNLGGCILMRDTYIERAISEHIRSESVYSINLEEPNRLPSPTRINSSVCLSVCLYIPAD